MTIQNEWLPVYGYWICLHSLFSVGKQLYHFISLTLAFNVRAKNCKYFLKRCTAFEAAIFVSFKLTTHSIVRENRNMFKVNAFSHRLTDVLLPKEHKLT